ncbi:pyruvate ferredoxin oxidoreductase [Magnetospirillum sp. UT-4]|uniref:pyruvate ferredoxin oxidoreductase n=1 Tax=Magnetospirillum sp. UT-4 TaxID=2681467 RepID=UPI001381C3F3|nr:pyruvate ferredoxin oxidoreductase [Magnetospirillum sp. UT-4]CAA7618078.1 Pyruvate synthase subunit PorA [Magnetospirillum sp. UT-4]
MLEALEGSQAIARAVALCRPGVVAAYPITPQTHIVENLSKLVADGRLETELVSVESEFSAASVALGASAAGSRAYTASSSQGILLMAEVLFNISGMRLPVVLTCANRALGAPINIWNDHADSMAVRDCGWIQLHCANNQEAVDTSIQAFRIAEATELPVMVCVDGFVLTHTLETLEMPDQKLVDAYLPPFRFSRMLDPKHPLSLGTLVGPEYFAETRQAHHRALLDSVGAILEADRAWQAATGRSCGGLLTVEGPEDARIGVLAMGSLVSTFEEAMEVLPGRKKAKLIKLRAFRPFPDEALRHVCEGLTDLVVVDRAISTGFGGVLGGEVRSALLEMKKAPKVHNVALGLGGRDVPMEMWPRLLAVPKEVEGFRILDLDPAKLEPADL